MRRTFVVAAVVTTCMAALPATALGHTITSFGPGSPGIGDPYFPFDGNGGYDAKHYDLDLAYDPPTDVLRGVATIRARATQNLSSFNLDFNGLTIRSIKVDGRRATWSRAADELSVTPKHGLRKHERFTTEVVYDGIPTSVGDAEIGLSGFIATDDGTVVAGQPEGADHWYPVNDHPLDKAAYTFHITVPEGLEAMANGVLKSNRSRHGRTTWVWDAKEPMASYLTTATIGEFDITAYRKGRIRYWDAIDPDLFTQISPRTGAKYLLSQQANNSYKRLTRTISVPAGGSQLSFWVNRDTEPDWDFMFVEAHHPGVDDWTTLADLNGHTNDNTGNSCPVGWQAIHPFLAHYQTDNGDGTCTASGSTGVWQAASGASNGYEQWTVDLSPYKNGNVELSISYASDDIVQHKGVFLDDVAISSGPGSTSFEDDGNPLDGWTVSGPPAGSPGNDTDWIVGTSADAPPTPGAIAAGSFAREPEILAFESGIFGRYPFSAAGGIVDDVQGLGFALETQTRPVYAPDFFDTPENGDSVVVHELAHQWTGDSLALAGWQHIWLNEGFATYLEWLWSEREGLGTAQEIFDNFATIPADDPFWTLPIGDPGPDQLFEIPVYWRGGMTLHALRLKIGDRDFFRLVKRWVRLHSGGNVSTPQFIALAERISGQDLGDFFDTWLFTPEKPAGIEPAGLRSRAKARAVYSARSAIKKEMKR